MPHRDHEKNRAVWNQMVDLHIGHNEYCTQHFIDGGCTLKPIELEAIGDVTGKNLLHLLCQFGLDTLSWARRGAIVTGVDIADMSIKRANELKNKSGVEAKFIRSDVLDLIGVIDKKFDIVFQSYGTHIWISDIFKWAKVVAHYLKPGGIFYIIDEHPINPLFLYPPFDYFMTAPERTVNPADYCETETKLDGEHVEWQHPVSSIVNALIKAGLTIENIGEYNFGYYRTEADWVRQDDDYWLPPGGPAPYPLMLSIKATKPIE
ncbi:MAG: class I SAM-dependent methyltransferase [candidate division Zixibacteria bacterium]